MERNLTLTIDAFTVEGNIICPSFVILLEERSIVGIYSDVAKINYLTEQFATHSDIYIQFREDGLYERLTVKEYLNYLKPLYNIPNKTEELLQLLSFTEKSNWKIGKLTKSEKQRLHLLTCFMSSKPILAIEEPFQNLDEHSKKIALNLFFLIREKEKIIILLSNNIEDLISSCDLVYRLDSIGLHKMDVKEENDSATPNQELMPIRFEKIPTKRNEKIILFNPPEIDYIESVEGEVLVYVNNEAYPCSWTLNELEQKLIPFGFFRCHRSYIVNLQKVREIITWTRNSFSLSLNTQQETVVPLSKNKFVDLKRIIGI